MDCNPDSGCEIQDNCCGRIMVIMKLNMEKVNTADEASGAVNGTAPYVYVKPGTKVFK